MNAKQAEQVNGISRRNLRFYEQQGLIHPARNPDNDYRDYAEKDIQDLKLIRTLRMLDVPLEEISACLKHELPIQELAKLQETRLKMKQQELAASIHFCRELQTADMGDDTYIDQMLHQMDAPDMQGKLFDSWKNDYRKVAAAEVKKSFSFTPDDAVTTPQEFTTALCKFANEQALNLVITKEGLEPEFEIDGIAYRAQRIYRRMGPCPVAIIRCNALHPEQLETNVKGFKGKFMKLFHNWWWVLLFAIIWFPRAIGAEKPGEVLLVGVVLLAVISSMYWVFRNHRN